MSESGDDFIFEPNRKIPQIISPRRKKFYFFSANYFHKEQTNILLNLSDIKFLLAVKKQSYQDYCNPLYINTKITCSKESCQH